MDKTLTGKRVKLIHTSDPHTDLKTGDLGTVAFVDDAGTMFVDWDNGSKLGLVRGEDIWEFVDTYNTPEDDTVMRYIHRSEDEND